MITGNAIPDLPLLSFCTTCANRLEQFQKTFDHNVRVIAENKTTEWIVVNFGSKDDLDGFMKAKLFSSPSRVTYVRVKDEISWHASIAKNTSHRCATGRILFNLDCDNFIGDAVAIATSYFGYGCRVLHQWSGTNRDGSFGRIAITAELFQNLGGYDESFFPMGYQDKDLLERASASGVPIVRIKSIGPPPIKNSKEDSTRLCSIHGMVWSDYDRRNRQISIVNIAAGRLRANQSRQRSLDLEISHGQGQ